jgi:GT2 family glycosyltransferase
VTGSRHGERVAVVVLTWNGRVDTLACLESLRGLEWEDLLVVVADNGSADGTVAEVRRRFPEVVLVENGENLGFAEGNNRGIRAALERGADAVFILNNDTEVEPSVVRELMAAVREHPDVGAASPVVRTGTDGGTLWFAGSHYDAAQGHAGRPSAWERGQLRLPDGPVEVDRAVGAAMLVPRSAIDATGVFDGRLFYLLEDVDWSLRMRRAGLRILLVPTASVHHHVAASQNGTPYTPLTVYYGTRNDLELGRRFSGLSGARLARRQLACVLTHVVASRRARRRWPVCAAAALRGWIDASRGRLGRHPGIP